MDPDTAIVEVMKEEARWTAEASQSNIKQWSGLMGVFGVVVLGLVGVGLENNETAAFLALPFAADLIGIWSLRVVAETLALGSYRLLLEQRLNRLLDYPALAWETDVAPGIRGLVPIRMMFGLGAAFVLALNVWGAVIAWSRLPIWAALVYIALEVALILTMGLGLVKVVDYHASALSRGTSEASQSPEPIR